MKQSLPLQISALLSKIEQEAIKKIEQKKNELSANDKQQSYYELAIICRLRNALQTQDQNGNEIALLAMNVGAICERVDSWDLIASALRDADHLKKAQESSATNRRSKVSEHKKKLAVAASEIWTKNPRLSASACAKRIKTKLNCKLSVSTIRRAIALNKPT
jgi:hypothetical protein